MFVFIIFPILGLALIVIQLAVYDFKTLIQTELAWIKSNMSRPEHIFPPYSFYDSNSPTLENMLFRINKYPIYK